jgi:hypothetical protein
MFFLSSGENFDPRPTRGTIGSGFFRVGPGCRVGRPMICTVHTQACAKQICHDNTVAHVVQGSRSIVLLR